MGLIFIVSSKEMPELLSQFVLLLPDLSMRVRIIFKKYLNWECFQLLVWFDIELIWEVCGAKNFKNQHFKSSLEPEIEH